MAAGKLVAEPLAGMALGDLERLPLGDGAVVRNHAHLHATYVAAFRLAGLAVRGCLEPCWTKAAVAAQRWAVPVPEAARQALVGLPMILIWELERVENGPAMPAGR